MKFRVTLKDPDGFSDGLDDAVQSYLDNVSLPDDETEQLRDITQDKLVKFRSKWVEYGEYVTLEFDTEANTCVVVARNEN